MIHHIHGIGSLLNDTAVVERLHRFIGFLRGEIQEFDGCQRLFQSRRKGVKNQIVTDLAEGRQDIAAQATVTASGSRAVTCSDLDGTLVATDTLWEAVLLLIRARPFDCVRIPVWLLRGKAVLKREICARVRLDVASLPYRKPVLDVLARARASGSRTCLVTAADQTIATEIAAHLELFDEVISSDGRKNMKAKRKADALCRRWNKETFDYIGDSRADIPVWIAAGRAIVVNPTRRLRKLIESVCPVHSEMYDRRGSLRDLMGALRPHQWIKNLLLFVPIIFAHQIGDLEKIGQVALGALAFSLLASAQYVFNDLLDLNSDRRHPVKRERPFAAGRVSIVHGLYLGGGAAIAAILLALATLPMIFTLLLLGYAALTLAYSVALKGKLMVDVITLAGFYVYRIVAGGVLAEVSISPWLLAFSLFFFLSLAFVKRYAELEAVEPDARGRVPGRGYFVQDLDMIRVMGPAAGYMAVLVLALYISADAVTQLYPQPQWLWPICVCLLYWITRVWFLAHRHHMPHDPVIFAIRDRVSHLCGLVVVALLLLASV